MAIKPVTVGVLSDYINNLMKKDGILSKVKVVGEVSNLTFHSAGHVYFSLKDETSTIKCVIFRDISQNLNVNIEEGNKIIVEGSISVFKKGGYYSLNVVSLEIEGKGDINQTFEETKRKLQKEGLFDLEFKKELPRYPKKIAVVTSPTGAAIKDILKTIKDRNSIVDILVFPVLVQGIGAPDDIKYGIDYINKNLYDEIDLIIVGRGGGSLEDLWAFNDEKVARAIFNSEIPIISAVGHEVDVTLADFVADVRAATPTAAAVIAVPSMEDMENTLMSLKNRGDNFFKRYIEKSQYKLSLLEEKIQGLSPWKSIKRGYGAVLDDKKNLITSVKNLKDGDKISILMIDGELLVEIRKIEKK